MASSILNSDDGVVSGTQGLKTTGGDDGSLKIQANGADTVYIDSNGNVGIGTNNIASTNRLQVTASNTSTVNYFDSARLAIQNSSATNNNFANIGFVTANGNDAASIWAIINSHTTSAATGTLVFATSNSSATSTERMRIDSSGNVGIGTSSPAAGMRIKLVGGGICFGSSGSQTVQSISDDFGGNNALTFAAGSNGFRWVSSGNTAEWMKLDSSGYMVCVGIYNKTVGATNRDVYVDNSGNVGYVSSLRESKTEIQDLNDITWLHQLNPVSFKYRKKDEKGNYTDGTDGDIQYGMIAEDVEQVRPDLCFYDETENGKELRGIQYSKLVPVMLKAIQEQQEQINQLKAEVAALKGA